MIIYDSLKFFLRKVVRKRRIRIVKCHHHRVCLICIEQWWWKSEREIRNHKDANSPVVVLCWLCLQSAILRIITCIYTHWEHLGCTVKYAYRCCKNEAIKKGKPQHIKKGRFHHQPSYRHLNQSVFLYATPPNQIIISTAAKHHHTHRFLPAKEFDVLSNVLTREPVK